MLRYRLKKADWSRYVDRNLSWISAQYALGLLTSGNRRSIRVLTQFYDRILLIQKMGFPVFEVPDQTFHADILLELYCTYKKKRFAPLIHAAADFLKRIANGNNGLIPYWPPDKAVLVDTLGMITRFCYRYAHVFGDIQMAEIADRQLSYTEEFCIDPSIGLPIHSLDYESGKKEGSCTWGRGAGWYLIGLSENVIFTGTHYDRLWQVLENIMARQDSAGFLPDDLNHPTHVDSSVTSMAAYSIARLVTSGQMNEAHKAIACGWLRSCIAALLSVTTTSGEVMESSGECQGAGQYSSDYGNFFAQGYTLAVLSMIQQNEELREMMAS